MPTQSVIWENFGLFKITETTMPKSNKQLNEVIVTLALLLITCNVYADNIELTKVPLSSSELTFDPPNAIYGVKKPIVSNGYEISVTPVTEKTNARVTIKSPSGQRQTIDLPQIVSQVANLWIFNNRLIVDGWTNGARLSEINIFDIKSGRVVDSFWCYRPTRSPDGGKIAFVKFFPAHFVEGWESQYFLYDLSKSREANHPTLTAVELTDAHIGNEIVGMQLYPRVVRDNLFVPDNLAHHDFSRLIWSPNGKELAFIDAVNGHTSLVVIDTSQPLDDAKRVSVKVAPVPELQELCHVTDNADRCLNAADGGITMKFNSNSIQLTIDPNDPTEKFRYWTIPRTRFVDYDGRN